MDHSTYLRRPKVPWIVQEPHPGFLFKCYDLKGLASRQLTPEIGEEPPLIIELTKLYSVNMRGKNGTRNRHPSN